MSESELEYRSGALKLEHGLHNIGHSFKRFKARARYGAHAHILYSSILHGNSIGIFIRDRSNFHNSFRSILARGTSFRHTECTYTYILLPRSRLI